ncbi:MAG TPA: RtcB family protein [Planctomycetaceae bacterium]|jgi:tRNA-splicing ligase RtcB
MKTGYGGPLERVSECCWRIPKSYKAGMRVDGLIYSSEEMIDQVKGDQAPEQVANVAFLPGIQVASLAMPDIHWGYGFTIGGVCATDPAEGGVISPGGVGYDINCGVRLVRSNLFYRDVKPLLQTLVDDLFEHVPTGVGKSGKYKFNRKELRRLMDEGVPYLLSRDLADPYDVEFAEAHGHLAGAAPDDVSDRAVERGLGQCGTLGSGNHFMEVQVVEAVFDEEAAGVMGLEKDMVCVMIHSGSRGLGYQVCDDALLSLRGVPEKYGIDLPDRQLACAPVDSPEGRKYIGTMRAAANFAWCNRQLLLWQAREAFERVFGRSWQDLEMDLIYDVAHNIAKFEEHQINGKAKQVWVHRKGATRAFPPLHEEIPDKYQKIGQPVLIPGDMGRASWVLVGRQGSMEQTFGTTCHGAGRAMSRTAAVKHAQGRRIDKELASRGVIARAQSWKGLAEEQPAAYKDVNLVVDVVHRAGLSQKVARMRPIGVIKG